MQLNLRETARLFEVSESTVLRWAEKEGLPAFLINGQYRFSRIDILEWAARHRRRLAPMAAEAGPEAGAPPALARWLEEGGVYHGLGGETPPSVMASVAERLPLSAADRLLACKVLSEREAAGSTAVGEGIAIPHPRSPLVFPVEKPFVSLCFLAKPVDFSAPDGKPVHALFVLVAPTIRGHLAMLSSVAAALHDSGFHELVRRQAKGAEILACLRGPAA